PPHRAPDRRRATARWRTGLTGAAPREGARRGDLTGGAAHRLPGVPGRGSPDAPDGGRPALTRGVAGRRRSRRLPGSGRLPSVPVELRTGRTVRLSGRRPPDGPQEPGGA